MQPDQTNEYATSPPQGDHHCDAVSGLRETLRGYFRRLRSNIYIGSNLPIYYPGEPMFAPDVIAVAETDDHSRDKWDVAQEGTGIDLAMDFYWQTPPANFLQQKSEFFARLGIFEYFYIDLRKLKLRGFRLLEETAQVYQPLLSQRGRYQSQVLGLELGMRGRRVRLYHGTAPLPYLDEIISQLESSLNEVTSTAEQEAERADEETHRADEAEMRLSEALHEIERLKKETEK